MPAIVAGTDVVGLVLQMSTGSSVSGSVRFDTPDPRQPAPSSVDLSAVPVDYDVSPWNGFATANIQSDGTFQMSGLHGPRRLQVLRVPQGWMLKEILVHGIDVSDRPITFGKREESLGGVEVVLTNRVSRLNGKVTDDRAEPAPGAHVIVFPADRDRWFPTSRFLRTVAAGPDGAFLLEGLPAGNYYVAAIAQVPENGAWQEPAFLESLRRAASSLTISEREQRSLNLRLSPR